jgi:two-component system cell cycle response regulator DivK
VPVIAITSYAMGEDEKRARAAGCDDFVAKP